MAINTKELCKQIRQAAKRYLLWTKTDVYHIISDRHWAVRYTHDALPREVLVTLFGAFADMPTVGETLNLNPHEDGTKRIASPNWKPIFESSNLKPVQPTSFLKKNDRGTMQILLMEKTPIFLNSQFAALILDFETAEAMSSGTFTSIYFEGGNVALLPYRTPMDDDRTLELLLEIAAG